MIESPSKPVALVPLMLSASCTDRCEPRLTAGLTMRAVAGQGGPSCTRSREARASHVWHRQAGTAGSTHGRAVQPASHQFGACPANEHRSLQLLVFFRPIHRSNSFPSVPTCSGRYVTLFLPSFPANLLAKRTTHRPFHHSTTALQYLSYYLLPSYHLLLFHRCLYCSEYFQPTPLVLFRTSTF